MESQIKYVTSMNHAIRENIGQDMLDSFDKFWPEGELYVYTEDDDMAEHPSSRIHIVDLHKIPGYDDFQEVVERLPAFRGQIGNQYDYRRNINAFNKKAFAQIDAATDHMGWLFWLDSDVLTLKDIPRKVLEDYIEGYFMCVMKRKTWHLCSSFVGWDCSHSMATQFFQQYYMLYMTGNVFTLPQWDDAYVLEEFIKGLEGVNDIAAEITGEGPYNVFDSVWMNYARHFKGNKNMPYRYTQLIEIIKQKRPMHVVEVGTWNGDRALQIAQASPGVKYIGLDLFEEATNQTDKEEKNVKAHWSKTDVEQKLYASRMRNFKLYKGLSSDGFKQYFDDEGEGQADLIYIDGGHSVETIKSDYENAKKAIKQGGIIIFDDYYTEMDESEMTKYGAQEVLKGQEYQLLPIRDHVQGGGRVQFAVVQC